MHGATIKIINVKCLYHPKHWHLYHTARYQNHDLQFYTYIALLRLPKLLCAAYVSFLFNDAVGNFECLDDR
jgi:hypothetical protein